MTLRGMDMNLLVVLDALIEEASVTRAAARLGMTQPAASLALSRCRALLGDPLLVRQGNRMVRTARAEALRVPLRDALRGVEALLAPPAFDPATAERRFTLAMSDVAETILLPDLAARLTVEAPGITLVVRSVEKDPLGDGDPDADAIDFHVAFFRSVPPSYGMTDLLRDRFVVLVRRGHPLASGDALDAAGLCRWPHVLVSPGGRGLRGPIDDTLDAAGHERRIAVHLTRFGTLSGLLEATELVACVPRRIAMRLAGRGELVTFELPFEGPAVIQAIAWHNRHDADPAHAWLRACLIRIALLQPSRSVPRPAKQECPPGV
jgi:DNA-binding transcriptional LysR family regulator